MHSERAGKSPRVAQLERAMAAGVASIDEARELQGLPKLPNGHGDDIFRPNGSVVGFDIPGGHRIEYHEGETR